MGLFDNVATSANVTAETDQVRGAKKSPLASGIYNCIIKYAYVTKAKSGAMAINLALTGPEDREIRVTEYVTSGDAKGNKTFYEKEKKDSAGNITGKEQFNLPGFALIDSLCQLVLGKSLLQCTNEKRVIKLYNFDAKAEVPTEVDMLVELVGKPVAAAILHQIQDKTAKNTQTGEYEPTGKTYATNVVDKFLDPLTRKTATEAKNNIDADFAAKWEAKWHGQVDNQAEGNKDAGLKGAPVATGDAAPKTSLFG